MDHTLSVPHARRTAAFVLALIWLCAVLGSTPHAASLFEDEAPIADRTEAERTVAFRQALERVVERLTGSADISQPELRSVLDQAPFYVQEYQYRSGEYPDDLQLWVRFHSRALESALKGQRVAYWGHARPSVLVWIALQEEGDRVWLEAESPRAAADALQAEAKRAGLPLVFPLFDLEDLEAVKTADLFSGYDEGARTSMQRYEAQGALVGTASAGDSGWNVSWRYYRRGSQDALRWRTQTALLSEAMPQGIAELARRLGPAGGSPVARTEAQPAKPAPASPPAPVPQTPAATLPPPAPSPAPGPAPGTPGAERLVRLDTPARPAPGFSALETAPQPGHLLVVSGVTSLEDYAKLDRYLAGVSQIKLHLPYGLGSGSASFRVQAPGGLNALERQLESDGVLRKTKPWENERGEAQPQQADALRFQYVK